MSLQRLYYCEVRLPAIVAGCLCHSRLYRILEECGQRLFPFWVVVTYLVHHVTLAVAVFHNGICVAFKFLKPCYSIDCDVTILLHIVEGVIVEGVYNIVAFLYRDEGMPTICQTPSPYGLFRPTIFSCYDGRLTAFGETSSSLPHCGTLKS